MYLRAAWQGDPAALIALRDTVSANSVGAWCMAGRALFEQQERMGAAPWHDEVCQRIASSLECRGVEDDSWNSTDVFG